MAMSLPLTLLHNGLTYAQDGRFTFSDFKGWLDLPAVDDGSQPYPAAYGSRAGRVRVGSRVVTLSGQLVGPVSLIEERVAAFLDATVPSDEESLLTVTLGTVTEVSLASVTNRSIGSDRYTALGYPTFSVQWRCADPRRYSPGWSTGQTTLRTQSAGVPWPWTWPIQWPETGTSSGSINVENKGNTPSPMRAVFNGPLDTPSVTVAGQRLEFDVSLGENEALMVDATSPAARLVSPAVAAANWLLDVFPDTLGADRSAAITQRSQPLEEFMLPKESSTALFGSSSSSSGSLMLGWRAASI